MRDPEWFRKQGRNDPHSAEQKAEHPYEFVSLTTPVPSKGSEQGHSTWIPGTWSGKIHFRMVTQSPMHVGSGVLELSEKLNLPAGFVVRSAARSADRLIVPLLPGGGRAALLHRPGNNRFRARGYSLNRTPARTVGPGVW